MSVKHKLHPRNRHREGYDFERLLVKSPELAGVMTLNPRGESTIDFSDQAAVRMLNRALLLTYYDVDFWEIPESYLCPPIPGRVDYIHHLADLLAEANGGQIPQGRDIRALDIGTGASLIYPLTGQYEYGWHFTAADIDPVSIRSARQICQKNGLGVTIRLQPDPQDIFTGVISPEEIFHVTLCNPPFHASPEQGERGSRRKWRNLGKGDTAALNFGGQNAELWCPGGEIGFIARMIEESADFAERCLWFTSLVSKQDSLRPLTRLLKRAGVADTRIVEMGQGQKVSRFIAWTYYPERQRSL
ncbi:23S rRNA (adenine(1618)-N(6))-methyltransferase RlmF [Pseudogemmobacter faecipullorum]|uniref:Ribosomal RNA large subunit methyltransferase F n=1 Tax=Pseudogemmobacter faecipullorum TaxID=2755041 RepID=A0ABS8CGC8_9RHOB|nr:23S rRNA (adenine(1618)-N(6))-methyltransferase RlmF [Pseudogemmobacter faecipullorum]MCB5408430.1 23S rRNA (adenine(1618)-N(6))-methyltransferase RlmF [Pseudogemmobacter faecipullorum]